MTKGRPAFWIVFWLLVGLADAAAVGGYYAVRSNDVTRRFQETAAHEAEGLASRAGLAVEYGDLLEAERLLDGFCARAVGIGATLWTEKGGIECRGRERVSLDRGPATPEHGRPSGTRLWIASDGRSARRLMVVEMPVRLAGRAEGHLRTVWGLEALDEELSAILASSALAGAVALVFVMLLFAVAWRWTGSRSRHAATIEGPQVQAEPEAARHSAQVPGEEMAGEDVAGEEIAGEEMAGEDVAGEEMAGEDVAGAATVPPPRVRPREPDPFAYPLLMFDTIVSICPETAEDGTWTRSSLTIEEQTLLDDLGAGRSVRDIIGPSDDDGLGRYVILSRLIAMGVLETSHREGEVLK